MATDDGVLRRWFWPTMDSAETAKSYVNIGVIALAVYSVVSGTLMAFASPTPLMHTLGALSLVLLWDLALAIFLYRGSRVAALVNLAIYIMDIVIAGGPGYLSLVGTVFLVMFVNAVGGAFAYQRFLNAQQPRAVKEESFPLSGKYNKEALRRMAETNTMVSDEEWEDIRTTREFEGLKKEMLGELTKSLDDGTFHEEISAGRRSVPPWWKTRSGYDAPWRHAPWRSRKAVNAVRILMVTAGLLLVVLLWRVLDYMAH